MATAQRTTQRAMQGSALNVNKLSGAFLSLASQATGVNPAIARLTNVLGAFAVGGPMMAGILAGITAVGVGWHLYTRDAREATDATQKLIDKLVAARDARLSASIPGMTADLGRLQDELGKAKWDEQTGAIMPFWRSFLFGEDAVLKANQALNEHVGLLTAAQEKDVTLEGISTRTSEQIKSANDKITAALSRRLDAQVALVMAAEREQNFGFGKKAIGVGTGAGEILPTGMVTNMDAMKAHLRDLPDLVRLTTDRVFELGADAEIVTENFDNVTDSVLGMADLGAAAIAGFATGAAISMHDFVQSAMAQLSQLIAKLLIIEGLKAIFSTATGGAGAAIFAALGGVHARAAGGPVRGGHSYLVGERGPEMFVPSGSGTIIPNGGGSAAAIMSMLPIGRPLTPREASRDAWHRELIQHLVIDNTERG